MALRTTLFYTAVRLEEATQNPQEQTTTQEDGLELLELAKWVALTQHQAGREFLFEHPTYASSWNTTMVSFVAGLEGVIIVSVDMGVQRVDEVQGYSHGEKTTLMTNDPVVADVFRPYRCSRDRGSGGRRTRKAQECSRRFCELLVMATKASLLRRDRREPARPMTLAVEQWKATTSQRATDGTRNLESTTTTHNTTTTIPPKYRSRWWISTTEIWGTRRNETS